MRGNRPLQKRDKTGTQSKVKAVIVSKKAQAVIMYSQNFYHGKGSAKILQHFQHSEYHTIFCISLDGFPFFDFFCLSFGKRKITSLFGVICCSLISLPLIEKMEGFFRLYLIP